MYITVTESIFRDHFCSIRPDNFSYEALGLLFDYFEDMSCDTDFELDVIAICCDYEETDAYEIRSRYDLNEEDYSDDESVKDWLEEQTVVVGETSSGFVFQSF
jgi:hypothetical protein